MTTGLTTSCRRCRKVEQVWIEGSRANLAWALIELRELGWRRDERGFSLCPACAAVAVPPAPEPGMPPDSPGKPR